MTASKLALNCAGLPEKNREKLEKRIELCLEADPALVDTFKEQPVGSGINQDASLISSYKEDNDNSDSADGIQIHYNSSVGRYGRATKDIEFGDIIFMDNPIGLVPSYPLSDLCCSHCLNAIDAGNAIASPFDPEYKFCSEQCLLEAFKTYHCFESRLNMKRIFLDRDGKYEKCTSRFLLNLRLVLQKSLLKHDEDNLNFTESECDRAYGSDTKIGDINGLDALDNMETHMSETSPDKQISYIIHCLLILAILENVNFIDLNTDTNLCDKIGYQLFHNQGVILMNSHYIYGTTVSKTAKDRNDQYVQGSSLYPVLPLLNHSCKPNTLRYSTLHSIYILFVLWPRL